VLAGADKSVDNISKRAIGTSRPNTSVIASGKTPLGKKALEKPSAISNQQGKKLVENKISTPCTTGKKSLEKPSAISKLQEEKLAKNKSSTPPTVGKQALKKPSSAISKQQEKEIVVNKISKRPTRKRSKRNTKETPRSNPWAMDNPNYKFRKSLLTDGDLKKVAPFTRKLHKLYMQRGKLDDDSHIMVALRPDSSAWPPRWSNRLQQLPVQLSDLYDLFNLDALDLTLLCCFIL
jgi:glucan-binding YG repeat protein